jgi:iron complex outermembrane recepter protein
MPEFAPSRVLLRFHLRLAELLFVLPGILLAQELPGTIQGRVADAQQAVVSQTTVELLSASGSVIATVASDSTGHYVINNVPPGTYKVRFTATGFEPATKGPVAVVSQQSTSLDATLKPERVRQVVSVIAEPLQDIEPTGSRFALPPIEIPASIVEMNSATLELRGYRQIEEAVENMPGATSGGSPADPSQFATRGFVGNQITLLRDGIYLGTANMITRPQNSFNVQSVDLLEGPSSVLYGQGAVGGTVNVITKPALFDKITFNGLASYGSFNTYDLGFGVGGKISDQVAFRSDISYYASDGYVSNASPDALNLTGSVFWKPTDKFNIKFAADILRDDLSRYYGTPFVPASFGTEPIGGVLVASNGNVLDKRMRFHNYNVGDAMAHSTSYLPSATLQWNPSPNVTVTDEVFYFHARRGWENAEIYQFLGPNNGQVDANGKPIPANVIARDRFHVFHNQNMPGNQLNVIWSHSLFGLKNRLLTGYEFYNISFARSRGFPDAQWVDYLDPIHPVQGSYGNFPGDFPSRVSPTKITDHAGFFEDVLELSQRLKLVTGLRYESFYLQRLNYSRSGAFQPGPSFTRTFHPLNYRAGLVYNFTSYLTGYGQFSTGQDPVGSNIFLVNAGQNFNLSTARQGEIGLKSVLPNGRGDATVAVYYISRNNLLSPVPGRPDEVETIGKQIAKGMEFSITVRPTQKLSVNFNTAYTHSRFGNFIDIATGNAFSGTQPANVPTNSTNLWLHYNNIPHTRLEVGGGWRFVGERFADNGNATKLLSYSTIDIYATYHFTERLSLTGRGRNLFDKTYAQWADIYYPTEVVLGAPRSGEIAFTFKF